MLSCSRHRSAGPLSVQISSSCRSLVARSGQTEPARISEVNHQGGSQTLRYFAQFARGRGLAAENRIQQRNRPRLTTTRDGIIRTHDMGQPHRQITVCTFWAGPQRTHACMVTGNVARDLRRRPRSELGRHEAERARPQLNNLPIALHTGEPASKD